MRNRKWTSELDALLLREVKLHKPHEQRHGQIGNVYENMAFNLNESARLPWITDRKHLKGRVQHLLEARRANKRATARTTSIEEEHGELELLLDDVIEEADAFKSTEVERREVRRERDVALAEGGGKRVGLRWRDRHQWMRATTRAKRKLLTMTETGAAGTNEG
jgi:hypothetical protein